MQVWKKRTEEVFTGGDGVWGERTEEIAARERRSLWILSVKEEAKLSEKKEGETEEGRKDVDFQQSSLLTVC